MDNHQLINQTSGNTEWYTPPEIIEAARRVMGGIDLDPASSAAANRVVKAGTFYGRPDYIIDGMMNKWPVLRFVDQGGLSRPWFGRMFQNHPFGSPERACKSNCKKAGCVGAKGRGWHTAVDLPGNADWINADVAAYRRGEIEQACILTYAATSEEWFKPLLGFPICFFYGRTNYIDPITKQPIKGAPKGSSLTYMGSNVEAFAREFGRLGAVHVPYRMMKSLRPYQPQLWATAV